MKYDIVSERTAPSYRISSPSDIYGALARYARARNERFFAITLNGAHEIIKVHIVSIGLVNRTVVHPREVFITAIKDNSCAIIVAHNHPSGRLDPSPEDRDITNRLRQASEVLGIALLDHVVFSKSGYFSFVEHGLLEPPVPD
jgi:DNA repair protein RadC